MYLVGNRLQEAQLNQILGKQPIIFPMGFCTRYRALVSVFSTGGCWVRGRDVEVRYVGASEKMEYSTHAVRGTRRRPCFFFLALFTTSDR